MNRSELKKKKIPELKEMLKQAGKPKKMVSLE